MRHTHTFATLEISKESYDEIKQKLEKAGYSDQFIDNVIDMHGIGLVAQEFDQPQVIGEKQLKFEQDALDALCQAFNSTASAFQAYQHYKHQKDSLDIALMELKTAKEEMDSFFNLAKIPQDKR